MNFPSLRTMLATTVLGVGLFPMLTASAGEPGVVRISDGIQQTAAGEPSQTPATLPSEITGEMQTSGPRKIIRPIPEGHVVMDVNGKRVVCHQHGIVDKNGKVWVPKTYHSPFHVWMSHDPYAGTLPPNYGFYPPTGDPRVFRHPVTYSRYLPNQFYGTPGMTYSEVQYPMVHTPTDTTQLGYTYQYVPQWMPNRANYPLAPNPVVWQRRVDPQFPFTPQHSNGKLFHHGAKPHDIVPAPAPVPKVEAEPKNDSEA